MTAATTESSAPPAEYRFPRKHRLLDQAAYTRVFNQAKPSRDKYFTVLRRPNDGGVARLGLIVAKKGAKLAVQRNRLKRLIRESFRHETAALAGMDLIVLAQPAASKAENKILFDSLAQHWRRCRPANQGETPAGSKQDG